MHGADTCGPAATIPELAAVVTRDGNPANPWRAHVQRLPGCYLLARTRQEAEALTTTRRWAEACLEAAELTGLLAPAPAPECIHHGRWGVWDSCQTPTEQAYVGDARGLIIASTGPGWSERAGRAPDLWWCVAGSLAQVPAPHVPY